MLTPAAPAATGALPCVPRPRRRAPAPGWLWVALWLLTAAAAIAGVALVIERLASRHLQADAARASAAWASHIGRSVQDLDLVFAGEIPSPGAQDQLSATRGTAGLVRFRPYDTEGRLVRF